MAWKSEQTHFFPTGLIKWTIDSYTGRNLRYHSLLLPQSFQWEKQSPGRCSAVQVSPAIHSGLELWARTGCYFTKRLGCRGGQGGQKQQMLGRYNLHLPQGFEEQCHVKLGHHIFASVRCMLVNLAQGLLLLLDFCPDLMQETHTPLPPGPSPLILLLCLLCSFQDPNLAFRSRRPCFLSKAWKRAKITKLFMRKSESMHLVHRKFSIKSSSSSSSSPD